jgi:hypothetical protein
VLDLDHVGVQVVSVREPWLDTSGPVRSLLVAIFSWVEAMSITSLASTQDVSSARILRFLSGRRAIVYCQIILLWR